MNQEISELLRRHRKELRFAVPQHLEDSILRPLPAKQSRFFSLFAGAGAMAAALALLMSFQLGRISAGGGAGDLANEEVVSAHVRSLMASHLSDVVSTDQHTVKPWFEGKIDFGPNVKDFANAGFPLIGGRLEYLAGRPTAALVYRSDQHIINVLEQPKPRPGSSAPQLATVRGYQIFAWSKDGMSYWAVSDLNALDLQKFVNLWL